MTMTSIAEHVMDSKRKRSPNLTVEDTMDSVRSSPNTDGDNYPQRLPKGKKSYHKKSRTGCATCRSRRVKCDEVHPICGNCKRYRVDCVYDRFKPALQDRQSSHESRSVPAHQASSSATPSAILVASRSSRHLLELQLMHQFITKIVDTLPSSTEPQIAKIWREDCPKIALKQPALLDTMCALAALHLALTERSSDCFDAHFQYMDSAIKAHRDDIRNVTLANVDSVWFTSSLLRFTIFAKLQERNIEPYTLPVEWLSLMTMAGSTSQSIWTIVRDNPASEKAVTLSLFMKSLLVQEWHKQPDHFRPRAFAHLLERAMPRDELEPWDAEIYEAYAQALDTLASIKLAIESQQSMQHVTMLLVAFLGLLSPKFSQLILDQQPRALVILAHYFAFMADYRHVWTIGATPQREMTGLASLVPEGWLPLMYWPLTVRDRLLAASNTEVINPLGRIAT